MEGVMDENITVDAELLAANFTPVYLQWIIAR